MNAYVLLKPLRASLGKMSRTLRLAQYLAAKGQAEQSAGLARSAASFWKQARTLASHLPKKTLANLSADENEALQEGTPLPVRERKQPQPVIRYVDRPVEIKVPEDEACVRNVRRLEAQYSECFESSGLLRQRLSACNQRIEEAEAKLELVNAQERQEMKEMRQQIASLQSKLAKSQNSQEELEECQRALTSVRKVWSDRVLERNREIEKIREEYKFDLEILDNENKELQEQLQNMEAIQRAAGNALVAAVTDLFPDDVAARNAYLNQLSARFRRG